MDKVFIPILEGHVDKQELYAAQQLRAEQIRKRDEAEQHQRQIAQKQSESNARTRDND